jgi:hypothetical protein
MISDLRERLPAFRSGDWLVCCDRCGGEFYASEMRREWTGLIVCRSDWEPRHPQDFKKGVPDRQNPAWVRPEPADTFVEFGTIALSGDEITSGAAEGTLIGLLSVTGDGAQSFRLLDSAGGRFKLDPDDSTRLLAGPVATDFDLEEEHTMTVATTYSAVGTDFDITVISTDADQRVTVDGDVRVTVDGDTRIAI